MPQKELSVGVDEFTLVLQTTDDIKYNEWPTKAIEMADRFVSKSKIGDLFGSLDVATGKLQAGYTDGLTFPYRPWHFVICWHEQYPKMGVCVKFSAFAYAEYKQKFFEKYQRKINVADFLKMIQSTIYTTRLSRIDLTADYFDYPSPFDKFSYLNPHTIYEAILNGQFVIRNCNDRKTIKTFSALDKDGVYETFYAGTRKGKTNGFLRCYDKRNEQIATHGFRYNDAMACESWVRFEAVFKGIYAHQISEQLLNDVNSEADLKKLIAKHISDKYRFFDIPKDDATEFTDDLVGIATGTNIGSLASPSARDNALKQSISYLRNGSGLFAVFYKVYAIWGADGERKLLKHLIQVYEKEYKKEVLDKPDIWIWLSKHRQELETQKPEDSF